MNSKKIFFILAAAVLLFGLGCKPAEETVNTALAPVETSLDALSKAEKLAAGTEFSRRRDADMFANLLPVAMVLTDGADVPTEGIENLSENLFGCNDRIAFVRVSRETASDEIVADALSTLFSVRETTVNGLYNSLAQSELKVDHVGVGSDGSIAVYVTGQPISAGSCDSPRIKEQIQATVSQYRPNFTIFLNGSEAEWRCFGDGSGTCK